MELTILVLTWTGIVTWMILSGLATVIWVQWIWQKLLSAVLNYQGLFWATMFWIQVRCQQDIEPNVAARLLKYRFDRMAKHEPQIAQDFVELLRTGENPNYALADPIPQDEEPVHGQAEDAGGEGHGGDQETS